jgi:hypothetical protein
MKSKYDYEVIRDYLHGVVDQHTARQIRELIRTDDVARNIAAGILQLEHEFNGNEQEIEAYIESLRQKQLDLIKEKAKTKSVSFGWMKLAAAILAIAVAGAAVWLMFFKSSGNNDLLAQELSEPYPLSTLERGESDINAGFEFYLRGDYQKAIEAFGNTSDDVSVVFYNGLSNLYLGNNERAITLLGTSSLRESRYQEQAGWFYSLALMRAGRVNEAKQALEKIAGNPDHYKSDAARRLLSSFVN